jgi:hypothetical protein
LGLPLILYERTISVELYGAEVGAGVGLGFGADDGFGVGVGTGAEGVAIDLVSHVDQSFLEISSNLRVSAPRSSSNSSKT